MLLSLLWFGSPLKSWALLHSRTLASKWPDPYFVTEKTKTFCGPYLDLNGLKRFSLCLKDFVSSRFVRQSPSASTAFLTFFQGLLDDFLRPLWRDHFGMTSTIRDLHQWHPRSFLGPCPQWAIGLHANVMQPCVATPGVAAHQTDLARQTKSAVWRLASFQGPRFTAQTRLGDPGYPRHRS